MFIDDMAEVADDSNGEQSDVEGMVGDSDDDERTASIDVSFPDELFYSNCCKFKGKGARTSCTSCMRATAGYIHTY